MLIDRRIKGCPNEACEWQNRGTRFLIFIALFLGFLR